MALEIPCSILVLDACPGMAGATQWNHFWQFCEYDWNNYGLEASWQTVAAAHCGCEKHIVSLQSLTLETLSLALDHWIAIVPLLRSLRIQISRFFKSCHWSQDRESLTIQRWQCDNEGSHKQHACDTAPSDVLFVPAYFFVFKRWVPLRMVTLSDSQFSCVFRQWLSQLLHSDCIFSIKSNVHCRSVDSNWPRQLFDDHLVSVVISQGIRGEPWSNGATLLGSWRIKLRGMIMKLVRGCLEYVSHFLLKPVWFNPR